jgi:hypothetical protein
MRISILIEFGENRRFRARAGEPFGLSAVGDTAAEAADHLATLLRERLMAGAQVAVIDLANGSHHIGASPLCLDPLPDDDWFFETMRQAVAENRRREGPAPQHGREESCRE